MARNLQLETFWPWRLNVLASAVSEGLARVYAERFGLDIPGWRVIATLGQFGQATSTAVGAHSRMHKTKVSRAVAILEANGWVIRTASPDDRRTATLTLTESGRRVYEAIVPLAETYQHELLAGLASEERDALDRIVSKLAERADRIAFKGSV